VLLVKCKSALSRFKPNNQSYIKYSTSKYQYQYKYQYLASKYKYKYHY